MNAGTLQVAPLRAPFLRVPTQLFVCLQSGQIGRPLDCCVSQ
jgi:hypothetical protein